MNSITSSKLAAWVISVKRRIDSAYAEGVKLDGERHKRYVIGKRTRYQDMETVTRHPRVISNRPITDRHDELRRGIYNTLGEAQEAAIEAEQRNPVGFVVLVYAPEGDA